MIGWQHAGRPRIYWTKPAEGVEVVVLRNEDLGRWVAMCKAPGRSVRLEARSSAEARRLGEFWLETPS